jgi:hypothetical protein
LMLALVLIAFQAKAQELNATVDINTQHVEGTNKAVFDNLKTTLTQFINDRHWTGLQFSANERIKCTFSIVVNKYSEDNGLMTCEAYIQSSRPVYNSAYSTTALSIHDVNFNFEYHEFDQLEFRNDQIDNNLTALVAYYVYLIIGVDLDTMSPQGGTDILKQAFDVANNAQSLNAKGWKAFDDESNRFGIINDYLDASMQPFRQLQYDYHRKGLDAMAENSDEARQAITTSLDLLKQAHANKSMSALPRLFSEYKRDELVGIYQGKETSAKKQPVYDTMVAINASQSSYWRKILQ